MKEKSDLPFVTLLLMISFASVNAVLFTPALPNIAKYFFISDEIAQATITWFLIGYTLGQLIYGPIANRFGRKHALYVGIAVQIMSSLLSVLAGEVYSFNLLVIGRFFMALGAGVGLKMTFTLVNEWYEPKLASQKIAYLMLGFAVAPGLGVTLGGFLNQFYGWASCFYAEAIYGVILLLFVIKLPETLRVRDLNTFKIKYLVHEYLVQFKNHAILTGGLLMGICTSFIYLFAAIAPFLAINLLGMNSAEYGMANILPPIGLIMGSLYCARLTRKLSLPSIIKIGIIITSVGVVLLSVLIMIELSAMFSLFLPLVVIYFGLSLIPSNASAIAMQQTHDKAHGSAVMNFYNMGLATVLVLSVGFFSVSKLLLIGVYLVLCAMLYVWFFNQMIKPKT